MAALLLCTCGELAPNKLAPASVLAAAVAEMFATAAVAVMLAVMLATAAVAVMPTAAAPGSPPFHQLLLLALLLLLLLLTLLLLLLLKLMLVLVDWVC